MRARAAEALGVILSISSTEKLNTFARSPEAAKCVASIVTLLGNDEEVSWHPIVWGYSRLVAGQDEMSTFIILVMPSLLLAASHSSVTPVAKVRPH